MSMVYLIPKQELPQQIQYTPVKYMDEIAMMAVTPKGPVILFTETDEVIFVTWDEIVRYAATAPRQQIPMNMDTQEPEEPTPAKKPAVREVTRTKPN